MTQAAPAPEFTPETAPFSTPEALADCVAGLDQPIEVQGAGTKAGIGYPVSAPCVSTLGLAGITHFEPREFVLGALAGTRLSVIEATLAEHDLILPFDPPRFGGDPTLGGVIATNIGGAERESLGAPRDNVLGAQYINGKGELLKAGGRVVKNVSGYDIPRGLSGSWGTLAILTEITIKVLPKARAVEQASEPPVALWSAPFVWRVSVPRDRAKEIAKTWPGQMVQQWNGALLWLAADEITGESTDGHAVAAGAGGHALLIKSPLSHRQQHSCFQPLSSGNLALTRLLKRAFDPAGRFNPGRMYEEV